MIWQSVAWAYNADVCQMALAVSIVATRKKLDDFLPWPHSVIQNTLLDQNHSNWNGKWAVVGTMLDKKQVYFSTLSYILTACAMNITLLWVFQWIPFSRIQGLRVFNPEILKQQLFWAPPPRPPCHGWKFISAVFSIYACLLPLCCFWAGWCVAVFLKLSLHQGLLKTLLKHKFLGLTSKISVDLMWCPGIEISNKLQEDAAIADLGTTLWRPLFLWLRTGTLEPDTKVQIKASSWESYLSLHAWFPYWHNEGNDCIYFKSSLSELDRLINMKYLEVGTVNMFAILC